MTVIGHNLFYDLPPLLHLLLGNLDLADAQIFASQLDQLVGLHVGLHQGVGTHLHDIG
jgi:hypothetical protein